MKKRDMDSHFKLVLTTKLITGSTFLSFFNFIYLASFKTVCYSAVYGSLIVPVPLKVFTYSAFKLITGATPLP